MFEIEEIRPTDAQNFDQSGHWLPPDRKSKQYKTSNARQLYRWDARNVQTVIPVSFPPNPTIHRQITIYHSGGRFWIVPYDATQWNVCEVPPDVNSWLPGWRALTFHHGLNGVSSVGFEHDHTRLAVQSPNQTWRPELFPDGYWPNHENSQPGGLQGNLALILALAAFSAPRGQMMDAIAASFTLGNWRPHNRGHGRE